MLFGSCFVKCCLKFPLQLPNSVLLWPAGLAGYCCADAAGVLMMCNALTPPSLHPMIHPCQGSSWGPVLARLQIHLAKLLSVHHCLLTGQTAVEASACSCCQPVVMNAEPPSMATHTHYCLMMFIAGMRSCLINVAIAVCLLSVCCAAHCMHLPPRLLCRLQSTYLPTKCFVYPGYPPSLVSLAQNLQLMGDAAVCCERVCAGRMLNHRVC